MKERQRASSSSAVSKDQQAVEAELQSLRVAIDEVDRTLLEQLNQRAELVRAVGKLKDAGDLFVYSAARERDLVNALAGMNSGPFPSAALPAVFREIISATRALESRLQIAFLGPEGSFSHLAVNTQFGEQVDGVPMQDIPAVFDAVERGRVDLGMVPVENTTEGVVTQALDTFVGADVRVCGERFLSVSYDLFSQSTELEAVKRVASHPQGLAQCRNWLDKQLPQVDRVAVASTAAAAALAAKDASVAALASRLAGERFGLLPVAERVEDRSDNTTRFLVIGRESPPPSGNDVTSLVLTLRKDQSGALYHLLAPFSQQQVNLTTIQSRPMPGRPWEYLFFIDVAGHEADPQVAEALRLAMGQSHWCKVLGSYPRAEQRARSNAS